MNALFTLALFLVPLFFIGAFLLTGLPIALNIQDYYNNRIRQQVTGPEKAQSGEVEGDRRALARAAGSSV